MMLMDYLLVGLLFYTVVSVLRAKNFKDADLASILRGVFFGVLLWPFALLFLLLKKKDDQ